MQNNNLIPTEPISLIGYLSTKIDTYNNMGSLSYAEMIGKLIRKLQSYGPDVPLHELSASYLHHFIYWLKTASFSKGKRLYRLSANSLHAYMSVLKTQMNLAVSEGLLFTTPFNGLSKRELPSRETRQRTFLTIQEIRILETVVKEGNSLIRKMFLFACWTGLRYSDLVSLNWSNICCRSYGHLELELRQRKTGRLVTVPLTPNALKYLPERNNAVHSVFGYNKSLTTYERELKRWAQSCGIDKNISSHAARHSFATNLISAGVELYTISKLLGHSNIQTTQIYAYVLDESKRKAMDALSSLYNNSLDCTEL